MVRHIVIWNFKDGFTENENKEALSTYQTHPEHKKIGTFISTVMQNRSCFDHNE